MKTLGVGVAGLLSLGVFALSEAGGSLPALTAEDWITLALIVSGAGLGSMELFLPGKAEVAGE